MPGNEVNTLVDRLTSALLQVSPAAVAVSGGVDSMTLAYVAHRTLGSRVTMFHALSPAVPAAGTERVKSYAQSEGWALRIVDAGEFGDERYLANPADRCFYCKTNLYDAVQAHTDMQVLSGTNLDDLSDWRPGLKAAQEHAVRHPFVEAEIRKDGVRQIARHFGLDIAELPSSPCLSSRVETGIRIVPNRLRFIDQAEELLKREVQAQVVRCRLRQKGIVVELDRVAHDALDASQRERLSAAISALYEKSAGAPPAVLFETYNMGGAFLREAH